MTFQIQRIYTKDISFEARTRRTFSRKIGNQKLKLDLDRHLPNWRRRRRYKW
ncbi:hypothetical protein ACVXHB_26235 [Escherichia coli]